MEQKNLQDIIPDREIFRVHNQHFEGIEYETYRVDTPIYSDQVQELLENGFDLFVGGTKHVIINKKLTPNPEKLRQNKEFWNDFEHLTKGDKTS